MSRNDPIANAAFGVLDYAAYPIGMLVAAPIVLRNLGVAQFGIWTVATAAVNIGSVIASGFGDANIQQVATQRAAGDEEALTRAVRSTMGIHLALGLAIGASACALAPRIAVHLSSSSPELERDCLLCLRIAGSQMFFRAIESVCISTQRAFERYGRAVRISVLARLLSAVLAGAMSAAYHSAGSIMVVTAALTALGVCAQIVEVKHLLHAKSLAPSFDSEATRSLVRFGVFSWLLAVCGVAFNQADRLIGGTSQGAAGVVVYALCAQLAQPIYGVAASGLHFVFPYLAGRRVSSTTAELRRAVLLTFTANVALVLAGACLLLYWGEGILHTWVGKSIAAEARRILPTVVLGSAALGLSITGSYAMLAFGRVKTVAWLNAAGAATMLLAIVWLLPGDGVGAIAVGRMLYGVIALFIYAPLTSLLMRQGTSLLPSLSRRAPAGEEA